MSKSETMRDAIFVLADRNIEAAIAGLLERRQALGIRQIEYVIRVHPQKDPGCCLRVHDYLRPFCRRYSHAVVVFDHEGCGREESLRNNN